MLVLYIDGYAPEEQDVMARHGIPTARRQRGDLPMLAGADLLAGTLTFIRSARLTPHTYSSLCANLGALGVECATPAAAFTRMAEPAAQVDALEDLLPPTVVLPADADPEAVRRAMESAGVGLPAFVRSEIESAAKYAGVEACTLHELGDGEVTRVVATLRAHVKDARHLIVKEIWEIAKGPDDRNREYRTIGVHGDLINVDEGEADCDDSTEIELHASRAFRRLADSGMGGASFVDLAVRNDGAVFVVEVKDASNGRIARPERWAEGLRGWAERHLP